MNHIRLETPTQSSIENPLVVLSGWCMSDIENPDFSISFNGKVIPYTRIERFDVKRVHTEYHSFGFNAMLDLTGYTQVGQIGQADDTGIDCTLNGDVQRFPLQITENTLSQIKNWNDLKLSKRQWCLANARCPICKESDSMLNLDKFILCKTCHTNYPQKSNAVNLLPPELYQKFSLMETENVSSHGYDNSVQEVIDAARAKGGKVLDCGSGLRLKNNPDIINLEIVDYPSTDILAVGQSLPFKDAVFDAVLSLAVLEHVTDPFICAKEILRVVKPGGTIYCEVPFLQPEHGYPNHFYNMTRQGLENLFKDDVTFKKHSVPPSGAPIYTLTWFLNEYMNSLPTATAEQFRQLTISDLLQLQKQDYWKKDFVSQLSESGNWTLASTTAAIMVKK